MTPKQEEAWRINWGLMIMSAFLGQLRNYEKQTTIKFALLEAEINKAVVGLKMLSKKEVRKA